MGWEDKPESIERRRVMDQNTLDAPAWTTDSRSSQGAHIPYGGNVQVTVCPIHSISKVDTPLLTLTEPKRT